MADGSTGLLRLKTRESVATCADYDSHMCRSSKLEYKSQGVTLNDLGLCFIVLGRPGNGTVYLPNSRLALMLTFKLKIKREHLIFKEKTPVMVFYTEDRSRFSGPTS